MKKILVLVLLLVVGFAAVSTTLMFNEKVNIAQNENDFDVAFVSVLIDGEESDKVILSGNKREVIFITDKLTNVGDSVLLEYKVKNNSTQYGANVNVNCSTTGSDYTSITGEFSGVELPLSNAIETDAQEVKSGKLNVKLTSPYSGSDDSIKVTCKIEAKPISRDNVTDYVAYKYTEDILNGADPVLVSTSSKTRSVNKELIPVTLDDDGTVTYADITKKWYSYERQQWANAIILVDSPSQAYKENEVIKEDDIESYFVWIPRYKYQIFDEGNYASSLTEATTETSLAREIQIEFENKDVIPTKGTTKGEWLTHPAFTNFDVNGLWVGKFETGYKGAATKEAAEVDEANSSKVVIKPNTYSWRKILVSNVFKTAYNYNRNLDSHMIKNTEWGAVAYLIHSKYGINTEVNINNNSDILTGYSAIEGLDASSATGTDATKTLPYNTPTGYKASTTGNITGIYDMSGGAQEYVAAYMDGYGVENGPKIMKTASGFTAAELVQYANYLDKYPNTSTSSSYNLRILGDATGEMGPFSKFLNSWYGDYSYFFDSIYPWLYRGGLYGLGSMAGQFYFNRSSGASNSSVGSRIVLAPQ